MGVTRQARASFDLLVSRIGAPPKDLSPTEARAPWGRKNQLHLKRELALGGGLRLVAGSFSLSAASMRPRGGRGVEDE